MNQRFSDWSNGWQQIDNAEIANRLAQELAREIKHNERHKLYGCGIEFIGRNPQDDDFVVELNSSNQYAYIHLTYNEESDPAWPHAEILGDEHELKEFLTNWNN